MKRMVGLLCAIVLCGYSGLFARECPGSDGYVSDGLVAHWDAIDNTMVNGVRSHDAAATTWCDLSGQGHDVTLPSYVTVGERVMFSAAVLDKKADINTTAAITYPTIAATGVLSCGADDQPITVEVVARRGRWVYNDNIYNLQPIFGTPRGAVGYRATHCYYSFPRPAAGDLDLSNWSPGGEPTDFRTISVVWDANPANGGLRTNNGSFFPFTKSGEGITLTAPNYFSMFGNARADIYIHAIRVYNRVLTEAEREQNYNLDKLRFTPFEIKSLPVETYDGTAIEPDPAVVDPVSGEPFVKGTDYAVSYANNERSGSGDVRVTGLGAWAGAATTNSFMIVMPEVYRELDYIESSGTQCIDTGYLPNPTTRMEASLMFVGDPANRLSPDSVGSIWGCAENNGLVTFTCNFGGNVNQDNDFFPWFDKSFSNHATAYSITITPEMRQSRQTVTADAATGIFTYGSVTNKVAKKTTTHTQHTLHLFGSLGSNGIVTKHSYYKMRVYGWKIWDGNELVRDFAPCYSVAHGKAGLMEKVSGHFYSNAGTSDFSYPQAVTKETLPADYHLLDYLVATGAQHIATGVAAAPDVTVTVEFMPLKDTSGMRVFGARSKATAEATADDLFFEVYLSSLQKWTCCCANGPTASSDNSGMWSVGTTSTGMKTMRSFTLDSWGNAFYVNDVCQVKLSRQRTNTGGEILLLKAHDSVQGFGCLRSAYVWKAGVLVRRLVPCYRVADGLTGMYDLVEGAFHPAGGAAPFIHGTGGETGTFYSGGRVDAMGLHAGTAYTDLSKFSVSAWVRNPRYGNFGWTNSSGFEEKYGTIVAQGALGGTPGFCCYVARSAIGDSLRLQLRNATSQTKTFSIANAELLLDNKWHHVAFTFDYAAGRAAFYLDGKERDSATSAADLVLPTHGGNFSIGARHDGNFAFPYRGEIAHVTMWNRALTAGEVNKLRCRPVTGSEPGLLDAWTLSEGAAGMKGLVSQRTLTMTPGDLGFVPDSVKWHVPGLTIIFR